MTNDQTLTVWERLHEYARTQTGPFTSQEVISWFQRHSPGHATDHTIRVHTRGASWNVGDRSQFKNREPFLTRIDRGLFRRATPDEIDRWRAERPIDVADATSYDSAESGPEFEWHTEEHTQRLLVDWLVKRGWTIVSTANTATREPGVDVVAA